MRILLNGEPREVEAMQTLAALIEALELGGKRIAVEVNGEIAPRSQHVTLALHEGDRVEIVQAIGGG
jgi:sulfur carrier protein